MKIKLSRKVRHESKVADDEVKTNQRWNRHAKQARKIESSIAATAAAAVKRQSNDWRQ